MLGEPVLRTGGLPLVKRIRCGTYRMLELQRGRDKRGLKFNLRPAFVPFNGRLADGVVIAAVEAGTIPTGFCGGPSPAPFEQELNLADPQRSSNWPMIRGFPESSWSNARLDEVGAAYEQNRQDALARMCSVRRSTCWTARCFWGQDRIDCCADALKSGRPGLYLSGVAVVDVGWSLP